MSGLDQKLEGVSRQLRFDKFIESVWRQSRICQASITISRVYRGSRGHVGPRSKRRGFIEALEVRQIPRVLIQSSHTFHKGYRILWRLNGAVESYKRRIYSPIAYLYTIITSVKKRDSSCGKRHHLLTVYIPIYIRSPFHS
jgi:hypothetical protein